MENKIHHCFPQIIIEVKPSGSDPYFKAPFYLHDSNHQSNLDYLCCECNSDFSFSIAQFPYKWEIQLFQHQIRAIINCGWQTIADRIIFPAEIGVWELTLFRDEIKKELVTPQTKIFKEKIGISHIWPQQEFYEVFSIPNNKKDFSKVISDGIIEVQKKETFIFQKKLVAKETFTIGSHDFVFVHNYLPNLDFCVLYVDDIDEVMEQINESFFEFMEND